MRGLGLRQTSLFNKALLCKLGWNFLSNDTILGKYLIFNKYVKQESTIFAKPTDSKFLKGLLKLRDFLASSICKQINNGVNTKVWIDPWIPTLSQQIPIPSSSLIIQDPQLRVSELVFKEPRRWNIILLQALFPQDTAREIENIPLCPIAFS